jgi:Asp/Glu/Hydantoin racemase
VAKRRQIERSCYFSVRRPASPLNVVSPVRVGVFDSGVGGLSVLRALRGQLPGAALHYVADTGYAPYGERSDEHVVTRSRRVASHLIEGGAQCIVIACNTATAVASHLLRDAWPQTPIVGVEPGIKPALLATRNGRIGVMATRATLGSEKFKRLAAALATREALRALARAWCRHGGARLHALHLRSPADSGSDGRSSADHRHGRGGGTARRQHRAQDAA